MYKRILILASVIIINTLSLTKINAEDVNPYSIQTMMAGAKIAGACAIFQQMAELANSTKMEGGQDFFMRMLGMQSARLGKTEEEYLQMCSDGTELHERHMIFLKEIGEGG